MKKSLFSWLLVVGVPAALAAQDNSAARVQLVVQKAVAARAAAPATERSMYAPLLQSGQSMPGEISEDDARLQNGLPIDYWNYQGGRDERVAFSISSSVPVTLVVLMKRGEEIVLLAASDTMPQSSTTAEVKLPLTGDFFVAVLGGAQSAYGSYTISARSMGSVSALDWSRLYPGGGDPDERYALLVGVSDYPGRLLDLNGSTLNDVELMKSVLVDKYGFNPSNILVLRDVEGNREQIIQAFQRHLGQAGPNGLAVFYYSGHGTQLPDNRYLTGPADPETSDNKDEALAVWGAAADYGLILDDELGELVGGLKAGRVLVVLDDCYSGTGTRAAAQAPINWSDLSGGKPFPAGIAAHTSPSAVGMASRTALFTDMRPLSLPRSYVGAGTSVSGGEALATQPTNHILLAASADNETSLAITLQLPNGKNLPIGAFTAGLYIAMMKATPSTTFTQLMQQVQPQVVDLVTRVTGKAQTPQVEGQSQGATIESFLAKQ
ncbi:MAG: caspase domain-containing protein [Gemmatimonadales bacterium]